MKIHPQNIRDELGLTRGERSVFELLKTNLSNREIAAKLFICTETVKFHNTSIFKVLGVRNREELIRKFVGEEDANQWAAMKAEEKKETARTNGQKCRSPYWGL